MQQPDVFYVMLSWTGPVIGFLVTIVCGMLLSRLKHLEAALKGIDEGLRGGHTDTVYNRLTRVEEAQRRLDGEIVGARGAYGELRGEVKGELAAIRDKTLPRETFEVRTADQNVRLEEIKQQNRELAQQNRDLEGRLTRLSQGRSIESPFPQGPKRGA